MFRSARSLVLSGVLAVASDVLAQDWPNFRGPKHDGISPEQGMKTDWNDKVKVVWERTVGASFSGLSCVNGRVYTCGTADGQQTALCLDAGDGKVIWQKPFEKEYIERQGGDGARSTPTVDDGRVYLMSARGKLLCLSADDGSEVWTTQYNDVPQWGYSGSVLIDGDMAIALVGGSSGSMMALDKRTGKNIWSCGEGPAGYSTPYPFEFNGKRYVCGFLGDSAVIADIKTGDEVAKIDWKTQFEVNAASPVYHDGHLFLSSGYGKGSILLKLEPDGKKLKTTKVWESKVLLSQFQSSVLWEGHLFTCDQKGLKCVEFMTGKQAWEEPRMSNGTTLIADGHLYVLTQDGELLIAPLSTREFKPKTRVQLFKGKRNCWTLPTLYRGKLYARDLTKVLCVDLSGK